MSSAQDDMNRRGHKAAPQWVVDFSKADYEPPTPLPNPLAMGYFCPTCETRIGDRDSAGGSNLKPCPFGCPPPPPQGDAA